MKKLPVTARIFLLISFFSAQVLAAGLPHSILNPAGPQAARIAWLTWLMIIVYGAVFIITMVILFIALLLPEKKVKPPGAWFVATAGIFIPTIILVVMLYFELRVDSEMAMGGEEVKVQVIGHGWWFEVRYPEWGIVDANEIHVPAGAMVLYELWSEGMIHSFWIPRLGGKRDQLPDHTTTLHLKADTPGVFHGVCAEYCGGQHARMAFRLIAHTPEDFRIWVERKRQKNGQTTDSTQLMGRQVFLTAGCASCHTIQGVSTMEIGPDLSHIGSRLTLGAGQFDNVPGTLMGWIANSQAMKPRNKMPRTYLPPDSLFALETYLRSLQ
jgi:cytochrome c oxidase subunit 2